MTPEQNIALGIMLGLSPFVVIFVGWLVLMGLAYLRHALELPPEPSPCTICAEAADPAEHCPRCESLWAKYAAEMKGG